MKYPSFTSTATFFVLCVSHVSASDSVNLDHVISDDSSSALEGELAVGWDSAFFSEGRDDLDGDSLFSTAVNLSWDRFSFGIWHGYSPDQDFDELELSVGVSHNIGNVDFGLGYTYVRSFPGADDDNEFGFSVAWSDAPLDLDLAAEIYYSDNSEGSFLEVSATRHLWANDDFHVDLSSIVGFNLGFVEDAHDGPNHVALQLAGEYTLTSSLALTAHTTYSWAIDEDSALEGDEQLENFFHAGVGLVWSF